MPRRSGLNQALIAGKSGTKCPRLIVRRQQLPAIAVEAVQSELCILLLAKGCGKNLEILLTHSGLLGTSDIALVSMTAISSHQLGVLAGGQTQKCLGGAKNGESNGLHQRSSRRLSVGCSCD